MKHFLKLQDFSSEELQHLIARSIELKNDVKAQRSSTSFVGKTLAMIFELSSTRTRVGFETAMNQLGGSSIFLNPNDTQLGRGEPIEDTAKVLSRMVDIVMIRAKSHNTIEQYANASMVPVINGMSNLFHPCQLLADMQTYSEYRGSIQDKTVAFIGDGYNMCNSYIEASDLFNFHLKVATPESHRPVTKYLEASNRTSLTNTPEDAVSDADLVVTDVWSSMGHEDDSSRIEEFCGFQVTSKLLDLEVKKLI